MCVNVSVMCVLCVSVCAGVCQLVLVFVCCRLKTQGQGVFKLVMNHKLSTNSFTKRTSLFRSYCYLNAL